jgi:addiction module RelE/StbE family toxin
MYQRIDFAKSFIKQFDKLPLLKQQKFQDRLLIFEQNPHDQKLRNHALKGAYEGYRSIDIEWDLRALYYIDNNVIVIFAFIGTHSQLY